MQNEKASISKVRSLSRDELDQLSIGYVSTTSVIGMIEEKIATDKRAIEIIDLCLEKPGTYRHKVVTEVKLDRWCVVGDEIHTAINSAIPSPDAMVVLREIRRVLADRISECEAALVRLA